MSEQKRKRVDPRVKRAVLAWANAPDLDAGAAVLADARAGMDAMLAAALIGEIAEITVETLIALLNRRDGFVAGLGTGAAAGASVEAFGFQLLPKQAERFSAWVHDQRATADALGMDLAHWKRALEAAMRRVYGEALDPSIAATGAFEYGARRSAERLLDTLERTTVPRKSLQRSPSVNPVVPAPRTSSGVTAPPRTSSGVTAPPRTSSGVKTPPPPRSPSVKPRSASNARPVPAGPIPTAPIADGPTASDRPPRAKPNDAGLLALLAKRKPRGE